MSQLGESGLSDAGMSHLADVDIEMPQLVVQGEFKVIIYPHHVQAHIRIRRKIKDRPIAEAETGTANYLAERIRPIIDESAQKFQRLARLHRGLLVQTGWDYPWQFGELNDTRGESIDYFLFVFSIHLPFCLLPTGLLIVRWLTISAGKRKIMNPWIPRDPVITLAQFSDGLLYTLNVILPPVPGRPRLGPSLAAPIAKIDHVIVEAENRDLPADIRDPNRSLGDLRRIVTHPAKSSDKEALELVPCVLV
jgi:hypothetical protein